MSYFAGALIYSQRNKITQSNGTSAEEIYIYQKDAQRNIIGISRGGQIVARYAYNAYGECRITAYNTQLQEVTEAQSPNHIAYLNPFRYKSYYYDRETGFYLIPPSVYGYTKYYDFEIGRVISLAPVESLNHYAINGLNLYLLPDNNPVTFMPNSANIYNSGLGSVGNGVGRIIGGAGGNSAGLAGRNLPPLPGWLDYITGGFDYSFANAIRTFGTLVVDSSILNLMRLDGITGTTRWVK